ncbi:MAG: selenide, water dikinase SelD [Acetobacterium sp.]|nr:selenide, water dikinase SelD [Acetobacterium sp.]MBP8865061.1 selenide, water dikinase SelD [Acetobacterium sp.]
MTKRLTEMVRNCGCAAKLGPGVLSDLLGRIKNRDCEELIIGFEHSDDAAAYRIDDDTILLQTLDFFPPIVDDPYTFGQIAAANALSDIYAMGGRPLTAMNIVCFPEKEAAAILPEILKGGADKVSESGAVIVGGHSVDDLEPKYGLSVTGITDPAHLRGNGDAREGDVVILTKPIGTGIIIAAIKGGIASEAAQQAAIKSMATLNKAACEVMSACAGIHGCTDVTGFSLAGHAIELAKASGLTMLLEAQAVPLLPEARELAEMGIVPGGTYRNRDFFAPDYESAVATVWEDLIFDPQTSGGLLISVAADQADDCLAALKKQLTTDFAVVGSLIARQQKVLKIV